MSGDYSHFVASCLVDPLQHEIDTDQFLANVAPVYEAYNKAGTAHSGSFNSPSLLDSSSECSHSAEEHRSPMSSDSSHSGDTDDSPMEQVSRSGDSHANGACGPVSHLDSLKVSPRKGVDVHTLQHLLREQDIKKQRLARKAELARLSRKRKKTRLGELEIEVAELKAQLDSERKKRRTLEENVKAAAPAAPQIKVEDAVSRAEALAAVLDKDARDLYDALKTDLQSQNAAAASQRAQHLLDVFRKQKELALDQARVAQHYIAPPMAWRFLDWILSQNEKFYEDPNGLWRSLFQREVGLSNQQLDKLLEMRKILLVRRAARGEVRVALDQLSNFVQDNLEQTAQGMEQLVSMLTPEQLARYLTWVHNYGSVCVQINL